jgi:GTPase SAR1 family protein
MRESKLCEIISQAIRDKATQLRFTFSELTSLPQEIGQLSNLTRLDLPYNQLSSLPAEIGQLSNLTELDLRNNKLSSLPAEIGQLSNLTRLDLRNNQLSSLPAEIGQLSSLTTLILSGNQLTSLPAEIGQLFSLSTLILSGNQLISLPAEIGQLFSLSTLILSGNQLTSLPAEIGQLSKLTELGLRDNQLSSLPAEIGQLSKLPWLDLSGNQLTSLPTEIGQLSKLTWLELSGNQLTSLPVEIGQLTNLTTLDVQSNPIKTPPIEIVQKGVSSIKDYLRQLIAEEKDYIYEAKLLIVGEAGAGKTTLAKKIEDQSYQLKDEDSTEGIDVIQWKFPIDNDRDFRVNIWDFGGQEIYHTTHQFFLTKRSLYVLVADTRKEDTDFFYWCKIVELLSDNSPLLIVKNEKQDRHREINERQLRGQFTNFKETLATNLATNRGLTEILNNIQHYIEGLPHIGNVLPKTWIKVREILEKHRHRNYISLEEYLNICENNGFKQRKDKLQLSRYLHDLGVCLHFQEDPVLKNTVIINPEWGTDAVYKVLDNYSVIRNHGKFTKSDLEEIWNEDKYAAKQEELLHLMIKFQLCYEIPGTTGNYLAPQLLTENQPDYDWDETNNLFLRYEYEFMPKGIITRFIVVMHSEIADQNKVWKSGVILKREDTWAEIIEYYDKREIAIRVKGKNKRDFLTIVTHELDKIHNSFHRLKYNKMIPCKCETCKDSQHPHFFQFDILKEFIANNQVEIQCHKKPYQMVNVRSLFDDVAASKTTRRLEKRDKVFVSYSHKDKDILERVQTHLKVLESEGASLDLWDDTQIKAGEKWLDEIEKALSAAKVAILLISTDFLASDFIISNELPLLLKAAENDGATILPLILKPCRFSKDKNLSVFQAVNDPAKPLSKLTEYEQDEVLLKLTDRIAELK